MVSENTESLNYISKNGAYDNNYNLYNNGLGNAMACKNKHVNAWIRLFSQSDSKIPNAYAQWIEFLKTCLFASHILETCQWLNIY